MAKIKTPLRYPGGKSRVADYLVSLMPKAEYYYEPMVGGGSVFAAAKQSGKFNQFEIGDLYRPLYEFYEAVKASTYAHFIKAAYEVLMLCPTVEQRRQYYEVSKTVLTDKTRPSIHHSYRKALAFFAVNRMSFSGTTEAGGFSKQAAMTRFTASSIERIREFQPLLNGVTINNWDIAHALSFTGAGDYFTFLDPPYYSASKLYGKNGELHQSFDHEQFVSSVLCRGGKWMITYDDCEYVRQAFRGHEVFIKPLEFKYGMSKDKSGKEVIITNYRC